MGLRTALLDLLYPPRCAFCRRLLPRGQTACAACLDALPRTRDGGAQHGDFFRVCVAPLYYEGPVRDSLLRFKFDGAAGYAAAYAPLLADCVREYLEGEYDLLSWVPLSRKRLRERGYDQSRLLAEAAAPLLGMPCVSALRKEKHTARQSLAGSKEKRRANIAGAYRVPEPERVAGRRDLYTVTLSECAGTLRSAGAESVVCAAVARRRD